MMKKLIKTVAMVSLIFLFTGCEKKIKESVEKNIKESEEIKSLKSRIDTLENLGKTQEKQKEQFNNMMN